MRSPRWILVLVAGSLAVLLAAAFLFRGGAADEGRTSAALVEPRAAEGPAVPEGPEVPDEGGARTRVEPVAEPPAPAARAGDLPAAYRRWLGRAKGRVVEADGPPVPGLPVEALVADIIGYFPTVADWFEKGGAYAPRILDATAITDEEGRFTLEDLDPRMPHVLVLGGGTARATLRFLDDPPGPGETVDLGDIALAPFATLVGRVLDEKSRPVAGARVRASDLPSIVFAVDVGDLRPGSAICGEGQVFPIPRWVDPWLDNLPVPTVRTAQDGGFRMEGAPIGSVTLLVDREGFPGLVHGPFTTRAGGEQKVPDLVLEEGEILEGKVVDSADRPVEGAELLVGTKAPIGDVAILRPGGVSGPDGAFRIPALRPKPTLVAARRGPKEPWVVAGPVDPGFDAALVKLRAKFDVFLDVEDDAGMPIEGPVEALARRKEPWSEVSLLSPFLPLDVERGESPGRFRARDLLEGEYEFLVRVEGFAAAKVAADVKGADTLVGVRLAPGRALEVRVVLEGGEAPVEFALVGAVPGSGSRFFEGPTVSARTDAAGRARLEGLSAGDWTLQAFHPAHALEQKDVRLPEEEAVTIALRPGGTIEGQITRGGLPPGESHLVVAAPRDEIPRFTASDEEGKFRLSHLVPGKYEVVALDRLLGRGSVLDYVRVFEGGEPAKTDAEVRPGETTAVTLDLQGETGPDAGAILGTVTVNGLPAEGALVRARGRGGRSARTDRTGAFHLANVPAGEVRVGVSLPSAGQLPIPQEVVSRTVKLAAGGVEEVAFVVETGRVRGRVVSAGSGDAIPYAQVTAEPIEEEAQRGSDRTVTLGDAEGRFVLDPVRAGTHTIRARAEGFAQGRVDGVRVPYGGEPEEVVLRLAGAVRVTGRVLLPPPPEGERLRGSLAFRSKDDPSVRAWASIEGEDGGFECNTLSAGTFEVRVNVWGPARAEYKPLELVVPPSGLEGVLLQPEAGTG